jgi:hypothetical protein
MTQTGSGRSSINKVRGPIFRRSAIESSQFALALTCIARAISSSGSSTRSSSVGVSQPVTTNSQSTTSPSSSWQLSAYGYALMSPRPSGGGQVLSNHITDPRLGAKILALPTLDAMAHVQPLLPPRKIPGVPAWVCASAPLVRDIYSTPVNADP